MRSLPLVLLACGGPVPDDTFVDPDTDTVAAVPYDSTADWLALTDGVDVVISGGSLASRVVVWGDTAFPLLWDEGLHPFASAARVREGRVVHVGHESHLGAALAGDGDSGRLLVNAVRWTGQGDAPVVGVSSDVAAGPFLVDQGFTVVSAGPADLTDIDVWVTTTYADHDPATDAAIREWIQAGGGVVAGGHAWWWAYSTGSTDPYHEHPGNQWLGVAGLTLSGASVSAPEITVAGPPDPLIHAGAALDAAAAHIDGTDPLPLDPAVLAADSAGFAASVLPLDREWWTVARGVLDDAEPVIPTKADPVEPAAEPVDGLMVRLSSALAARLPADEIDAHSAATDFPGEVPAGAERVTRPVVVDATYAGRDARYHASQAGAPVWRSTGLYVPAGEVVTVAVPSDVVGSGLTLLVGAHTDRLWGADSWSRMPEITRAWPVDSTEVEVASAFGGLLFVRVPGGTSLGEVELTVAGAVEAPRYELSDAADAMWGFERQEPGPWAELSSPSVALVVPTSLVQDLEDPFALMRLWQDVLDADAELAAIDPVRVRAERMVVDRQISAGWMHSGYPIMAHLESAPTFVDPSTATTGDWGAFHELGHNHQWSDWMLPGAGEAICNLWSVYAMEQVVGRSRDDAHPAMSPTERAKRIQAFRDGSGTWSVWTALETYLQVQEAFGWEPLIAVQERYLTDAPADAPASDQAKADRWIVRLSEATGRDLTAFHAAWGFTITQDVAAAVAHLPAWDDHPMR